MNPPVNRVPIRYCVVEDSRLVDRGTAIHLLSEAEVALLRGFMTLLLLPADTGDMVAEQPPFLAAVMRIQRLPSFRKAESTREPPVRMLQAMASAPLLMLMVGNKIPTWLESLAAMNDVGVLSPSAKVISQLSRLPQVHPGLLQGMQDIREAYRVFRGLLAAAGANAGETSETRAICSSLAETEIFSNRPRLDFIPPFPLPAPYDGRPAAYLLNRLSNNVDEPSLSAESLQGGVTIFPHFLQWVTAACRVLAFLELDLPLPISITRGEVERIYTRLTQPGDDSETRFELLWGLGRRLTSDEPLAHPLFAIGVPRLDLLRGRAPSRLRLDPAHKKFAKFWLRAVHDFVGGSQAKNFSTTAEKEAYSSARETLLLEQRLISCQTAWLAAVSGCIPIQLRPVPGRLYNELSNLNKALENNSRKIQSLFQSVELLLSAVLPSALIDQLTQGNSPVTFFSDLPFEWTLTDEWPVCLTRPVSRIPMGLSHWDTLAAALESPVRIDASRPDRVLVLDLIETGDPVRTYSDIFAAASNRSGRRYTYSSPRTPEEFKRVLAEGQPDIVVLDTHGSYDRKHDRVQLQVGGVPTDIDALIPDGRVPPLWVLSACHTSVTGAIEGSMVRALLARGGVCVVATLNRIDAFAASMFVGRLLTEVYSPLLIGQHPTFAHAFFAAQYTTALLYDPLLPIFRIGEKVPAVKQALGRVLSDFFIWSRGRGINVRRYRYEIAQVVGELLLRHGLQRYQLGAMQAQNMRPETLLFTAFGLPSHIDIEFERK